MSKKTFVLKSAICFTLLTLAVFLSAAAFIKADEKGTVTVTNEEQYKTAVKNSKIDTIIYQTESNHEIVLASNSKTKKKNLVIECKNASIVNNSKFKSVKVNAAISYTENASGNTLDFNTLTAKIEIKENKTVKKLIFRNWVKDTVDCVIRNGGKVSSIILETDGNQSKYNKKKRKLSISAKYDNVTITLDKSGRKTKMVLKKTYSESKDDIITYTYDENGNLTKVVYKYPSYVDTKENKYDSNNNLIETKTTSDDGWISDNYVYKYDKSGKITNRYTKKDGKKTGDGISYTYDNKGNLIKEDIKAGQTETVNLYNADGFLYKKTKYTNGKLNTDTEYILDKNGFANEVKITNSDGSVSGTRYVRDKNGNIIYSLENKNDVWQKPVFSVKDGYIKQYDENSGEYSYFSYTDEEALIKEGFVIVDSLSSLIDAVKPGAKILLKKDQYNLTPCLQEIWDTYGEKWNKEHPYVQISNGYGGVQISIKDLDGLMIVGGSSKMEETHIQIESGDVPVITFENCSNIVLCNLKMGHKERNGCGADVIYLKNSSDIKMYNMDLYGCGVTGIGMYSVKNLFVYDSNLHNCIYGPFWFPSIMPSDVKPIEGTIAFYNCTFVESSFLWYDGGRMFDLPENDVKLIFDNCVFGEKETYSYNHSEKDDRVVENNCIFSNVEGISEEMM